MRLQKWQTHACRSVYAPPSVVPSIEYGIFISPIACRDVLDPQAHFGAFALRGGRARRRDKIDPLQHGAVSRHVDSGIGGALKRQTDRRIALDRQVVWAVLAVPVAQAHLIDIADR